MNENMARIFDVLAVSANSPSISPDVVPLSPEDPEFEQRRYWRLSSQCCSPALDWLNSKARRLPVPNKLVLSFFGKGIDERCHGLVEELDQ
jgi:hypothetical protein